ncbi:hypothetical protein CY35_03G084900 [Sphagnum magellanicum]|nr:hypothetical protein CY35_03G084900 [Sphagnum magellanicum]
MIVEYGAAQIPGHKSYRVEGCDHFSVCKPPDQNHSSYDMLLQFLKGCQKDFLWRRESLPTLPKHVIGLVEVVANVKQKIVDNHMLVVVGMGGIGKTTLVKKLYHQIHDDFKKSSFLENVKKKDIVEVQKKLIMDLCGKWDPTRYFINFKNCWTEMKVLVIIDDVEETQIVELLGTNIDGIKRSENGSRIIMTGQNWKDFENVISDDGKFGMEGLNDKQAMELFSWKAFEQSKPPRDFASITNEVVRACQGLPLSLEVTGSWLCTKKNAKEWEESLLRLKNAQPFGGGCIDNDKLWGRLRICYDDLAHEEQEMFLDIACFFSEYNSYFDGIWGRQNGITSQKALQICKVPSQHSPMICLQNLMDRSLVKVNDKGNLVMHDQLRDMGRQIVREASRYECRKQSRIWDKEEARMVLFNEKVTSNIQAMWLPENLEPPQEVAITNFHKMKKLRMLIMESASEAFIESCFGQHFRQLKWLHINSHMKLLPKSMQHLNGLIILQLQNCQNLVLILEFVISNMTLLMHLDFYNCSSLIALPTTIGQLRHLTKLHLTGCKNLKELPQSISNLSSLSMLDLSHCKSIESLPTTIGQLQHLTQLRSIACVNLKELPQSIGNLSSLSMLDLSYCRSIESLPTTIGQFQHLTELRLVLCENLKELPQSIGNMSSLSMLDLSSCMSIESLPTTLGQLQHLTQLRSTACLNLKELPQSIGNLSSLSMLDLSYCRSIESLPTTFGQLQHLTELRLQDCVNLKELPQSIGNMSSLSMLDLSSCMSIESLPTTLGQLQHLTQLRSTACLKLKELPQSIGNLSSLSMLDLSYCRSIESLPTTFGQLQHLTKLWLVKCVNLKELPQSIGNLSSLSMLDLVCCESIESLPTTIGQLQHLTELWLIGCENLKEVPQGLLIVNLNLSCYRSIKSLSTTIG